MNTYAYRYIHKDIYISFDPPSPPLQLRQLTAASVRRESNLGERRREALLSVNKYIDVNMYVSICTSIHTNTCSYMYR